MHGHFKTLDDIDVGGRRILLRADLNVPIQDGKVTDATRIKKSAETIQELINRGAKVIIITHLGRPKNKQDTQYSLRQIVPALSSAIGKQVAFVDDCIGKSVEQAVTALKNGEVLLLENVRFYPEEEKNDAAFASNLARLGDIYVNDAFSAAHRAHASLYTLAKLLPAAAGRLMQAELNALEKILHKPERPLMAIVGGSKISTKLDLLGNLVEKVDVLVLGGGMANTFLAAEGCKVGKSRYERDMLSQTAAITAKARVSKCELVLPVDAITATELKPGTKAIARDVKDVKDAEMILDIGLQTVEIIRKKLEKCKTVVWNGPLGAFETKPFDAGTTAVAKTIADLTRKGKLTSVAGGGDTVAALDAAGVEKSLTYVSTAGGAFLEWLEGKELPGVAALNIDASSH